MSPSRFNQTGPKIGLSVRLAETQAEIEAAQRLRYQVFVRLAQLRSLKKPIPLQ